MFWDVGKFGLYHIMVADQENPANPAGAPDHYIETLHLFRSWLSIKPLSFGDTKRSAPQYLTKVTL